MSSKEKGFDNKLLTKGQIWKCENNMIEFYIKVKSDFVQFQIQILNLNYEDPKFELAMVDLETILKYATVNKWWLIFK